jgi:hypothetical protein
MVPVAVVAVVVQVAILMFLEQVEQLILVAVAGQVMPLLDLAAVVRE